jgi:hypothetical protein
MNLYKKNFFKQKEIQRLNKNRSKFEISFTIIIDFLHQANLVARNLHKQ